MKSADHIELQRFWIRFELPPAPTYEGVVIDGDLPLGRALRSGVGVTAYDIDDAVGLIAAWLTHWNVIGSSAEMPRVASADSNVEVDSLGARQLGNPAWRGIWSPPDNLGGPTPLGSNRR